MWRLISKLRQGVGRGCWRATQRERYTVAEMKFINTCKNPIKILQFMAVKQVYMLESLEISHLTQIIWCFMNYQKFKRQILNSTVSHFVRDLIFVFIWDLILLTPFDKSDFREIAHLFTVLQEKKIGTGNCKNKNNNKKTTCPPWQCEEVDIYKIK